METTAPKSTLELKRDEMKNVNRLWQRRNHNALANIGYDIKALDEKVARQGGREQLPFQTSEIGDVTRRIRAEKARLRVEELNTVNMSEESTVLAGGFHFEISVERQTVYLRAPRRLTTDEYNRTRDAGFNWSQKDRCWTRPLSPTAASFGRQLWYDFAENNDAPV